MATDPTRKPVPPWSEFLEELDASLSERAGLHCIGGFVITVLYSLPRPTADIDYWEVVPNHLIEELQAKAGPGSPLAKKYKVYLQHVAVNTMPQDYGARQVEIFPGRFEKLRLYAPDPYDLILSKLERNSSKDRDDGRYLFKVLSLNSRVLHERYQKELRPYLSNETRHDLTMKLWLEDFESA